MEQSKGSVLDIVRWVGAFCLNLIAAQVLHGAFSGQYPYWFLRTYFPYMSLAEQVLLVNIFLTAILALAVSLFWSTTTAKWVWIAPMSMLLLRMAMFAAHPGGSVMEAHHGFWKHFFAPELSLRSVPPYGNFIDFQIFTLSAVRISAYSLVAWATAKWIRPRLDGSLPATSASSAEPIAGPTVPVLWPRAKSRWLSATNVLIAINVAIFAAMVASGVSLMFARNTQLLQWGANMRGNTMGGQPWRLVTYSFVHLNFIHLATNMVCLWWLGRMAEKIVGPSVLAIIYLLTAIGSGLLRLAWSPNLSVGASGAIFGIAGALIYLVWFGKVKMPPAQSFFLRITIFILFDLITSLSFDTVNTIHVGGLATGLLFGLVIVQSLRSPSLNPKFSTVRLFQGREAAERHDYDAAIQYLQTYVSVRPGDAETHALLGCSFHALERYDEAVREYQLALDLGYKDPAVDGNLAAIETNAIPECPVP